MGFCKQFPSPCMYNIIFSIKPYPRLQSKKSCAIFWYHQKIAQVPTCIYCTVWIVNIWSFFSIRFIFHRCTLILGSRDLSSQNFSKNHSRPYHSALICLMNFRGRMAKSTIFKHRSTHRRSKLRRSKSLPPRYQRYKLKHFSNFTTQAKLCKRRNALSRHLPNPIKPVLTQSSASINFPPGCEVSSSKIDCGRVRCMNFECFASSCSKTPLPPQKGGYVHVFVFGRHARSAHFWFTTILRADERYCMPEFIANEVCFSK